MEARVLTGPAPGSLRASFLSCSRVDASVVDFSTDHRRAGRSATPCAGEQHAHAHLRSSPRLDHLPIRRRRGHGPAQDGYFQTNLVSNQKGLAILTDPNLQDPWGIALSGSSPFWISDQASSLATLYSVNKTTNAPSIVTQLVVVVPNLNGAPASPPPVESDGPTGQVSTAAAGITTVSTDFNFTKMVNNVSVTAKASFAFANLDGSISAWAGLTGPAIVSSVGGASFTGLAIGNSSTGPELYAADQNSKNIDVFNNKFQMTGSFTDPNAANFPTGYAAFNVQNLSLNGVQTLFVTFANQSGTGGIVDEFTTNGTFIKTLINDTAGAHLDVPWGLALAPSTWGQFGGDLLVANNNGPGTINAYNPTTGLFEGSLTINVGGPPGTAADLWGISFGNGGNGGSTNVLYFTAGLASQGDGLFGSLSVPEPSSGILGLIAAGVLVGGWRWKHRRRALAS